MSTVVHEISNPPGQVQKDLLASQELFLPGWSGWPW